MQRATLMMSLLVLDHYRGSSELPRTAQAYVLACVKAHLRRPCSNSISTISASASDLRLGLAADSSRMCCTNLGLLHSQGPQEAHMHPTNHGRHQVSGKDASAGLSASYWFNMVVSLLQCSNAALQPVGVVYVRM